MQSPLDAVVEAEYQPHNDDHDRESSSSKLAIWHNRDFLMLWSGQVTSMLGGQMAGLAYPLLVLSLTHSTTKAGLIAIFWTAPFVTFGIFAGALVDRWNRKKVMIVSDTIRMFGVLMLPIAFALHILNVSLVYAAAFAEGIGFCFFNIAEVSALPQVVTKEQLPHAMAMNESGFSTASTVGPGLAGALIGAMRTQVMGTVLVFIVDGVSYAVSLVALCSIRIPFQQARAKIPTTSILDDVREGLAFISSHERIRTLAAWSAWTALMFGPWQLALIVMVRDVFHGGAGTIGLMLSAGGIGGIVGALIAPRLKRKVPFGTLLISIVALQSVGMLGTALAPNLIVLAAMQFLVQMGGPLWNVTQMSYRLSVIPDKLQGRVNASYRILIFAAFPIGAAFGGAMLEHVSSRLVFCMSFVGVAISVVVILCTNIRGAQA